MASRFCALLVAAVLASALFAGCGGSSSSSSSSRSTSATTPASTGSATTPAGTPTSTVGPTTPAGTATSTVGPTTPAPGAPSKQGTANIPLHGPNGSNNPRVAQAIAACKASVAVAPRLTADEKTKLAGICEDAYTNPAAAQAATKQICEEVIKSRIPAGAAQTQALGACAKA